MFYLYHHNDLRRLAELFGALREHNRAAPLQMDTVLVPSRGLGRWLAIQIAEDDGVVANIDLDLPGSYIWQLLRAVAPQADSGQHFEADALPWHLYFALPAMAAEIPAVAAYLGAPVDEIRRWQLARRLAAVFDEYLIYRADMLIAWEQGSTPAADPGRWQARVWRYLTRPERLGHNHRARMLREFIRQVAHDAQIQQRVAAHCPPVLYCFGLATLAPDHLRLLYALAGHIDVHFLLPNPSAAYWGDITASRLPLALPESEAELLPGEAGIEAGHPLLGALGRMARDMLRVLYADEFAGMLEPELGAPMAYARPQPDSLLHRIQADIVDLDCSNPAQGMAADDCSFEIHSCHGPLREVQVLQDQLLDRLAADDKRVAAGEIAPDERLAPRDIVVMLPDVAAYAPAIEAVFGGAPAERRLPFGLADRPRAAAHPLVTCFASLLDLPLARWQASELLDLLAVPAVMHRFGLVAGELQTITRWIKEAGIRWGRDAEHRRQLGAGTFAQNSWRFGFDRLLLGVAQADEETLIDDVAPWSDLEGGDTAALGKLWRFERTLADCAHQLAEPATPGRWQARLNELVDALMAPAADSLQEQRAIDGLRQIFAQLETAESCTRKTTLDTERTISWEAMRDMLKGTFAQAGERQPFLAGGITFCGMVPLRAVPFRLVCILGLNDDAFPRQDHGHAFNVMQQQPRLGDRSVRADDRLLFLQALTAARDAFYISHVGQDVHTGEPLPPSPIVGETLEFIQRHYFRDWSQQAFRERLIHAQPMQPFSPRYFGPAERDPRVFTFTGDWRAATHAAGGARTQPAPLLDGSSAASPEPITAIDLATLKRFFEHPPRAFFRERLQLDLAVAEEQIKDDEPITLDALAKAQLRQRLFDSAVANESEALPPTPGALERARGQLPPGPLAVTDYAQEAAAINSLLPLWRHWQRDGVPASIDIDLAAIGNVRLTGRVEQCWPQALRRLRTGKLTTKYRLRYWIDYLAAVASGHAVALQLAGFAPEKKSGLLPVRYGCELDQAAARAELHKLVQIYLQGQQSPLHFHPDMMEDYQAHQNKAFSNFSYRYSKRAPHPSFLVHDAYFALLIGEAEFPLGETEEHSPFVALARTIVAPMDAALQRLDGEMEMLT